MLTSSTIKIVGKKNPSKYFKFKDCLVVVTNIVKNNNKEKWLHSDYGRVFNGAGSRKFGNDFARQVIFGVDDSLSCQADSHCNNILLIDEGSTYGISESFGC